MALPVEEVSGFSVQVSVVCFSSLTPETLRSGPLGPDFLLLWHGILVAVKVG